MDESAWEALKQAATKARANAYAPYSGFTMGAAVQGARFRRVCSYFRTVHRL